MQLYITTQSMNWSFEKYQGTGNDFIIIDDRRKEFPQDEKLISRLCDRKFGIGSDGLMLIRDATQDFEMIFFNPDGSKSLCGNGSRCAVQFARSTGLAGENGIFSTTDGEHLYRTTADTVGIQMHNISRIDEIAGYTFLNTGSPHVVIEKDLLDDLNIEQEAKPVRHNKAFEHMGGANVNFVEVLETSGLKVRTFERGVENETLSCGTGVTAVALAIADTMDIESPVEVYTKGGKLFVHFEKRDGQFENIWLQGPARFVYKGIIDLDDIRE